jgi:chemotaxis protein MotB
MKKRNLPTSHSNADRWLLTYSDLITLLLGLFVILYAMSKIDAGKYSEMVSALGGVFGASGTSLPRQGNGMPGSLSAVEAERQKIVRDVQQALGEEAKDLPVSISETERGVTVHIMEELLFASGNAEIKQGSLATLDNLAGVLKRLPNDLRVEGHTDNVPITTQQFPSNWHLSVARALNIGYYLINKHGLKQEKVSIVGYSEFRPLVPNDTAPHRAQNRRVDIVIVSAAQPSADELPSARFEPLEGKATRIVL